MRSISQQAARSESVKSVAPPPAATAAARHVTYMQKTLKGGIMLIELNCRPMNFSVSVYAFEFSRIPLHGRINSEVNIGGV